MIDELVALIHRRGSIRDYELERLTGATRVARTLAPLVARGELVHCTVERPGKPVAHEYRPSSLLSPRPFRGRRDQVHTLLRGSPEGLFPYDVAKRLGMTINTSRMILESMAASGELRRQRVGRSYRYRKPGPDS